MCLNMILQAALVLKLDTLYYIQVCKLQILISLIFFWLCSRAIGEAKRPPAQPPQHTRPLTPELRRHLKTAHLPAQKRKARQVRVTSACLLSSALHFYERHTACIMKLHNTHSRVCIAWGLQKGSHCKLPLRTQSNVHEALWRCFGCPV